MSAPRQAGGIGETVLSARNVAKSYGNIHALKGVNFDVRRGEVTTLFGENGAGKSTLMRILSGVTPPTSGEVILDGQSVTFSSSVDARDRGISIIHQELSLAPNLSVRDNIFMGREIRGPMGVDFAEEERQARALMEELEEDIDPLTPVEELRLGQQQIVEIARALSINARILIMDEPTSSLTQSETDTLYGVIDALKAEGAPVEDAAVALAELKAATVARRSPAEAIARGAAAWRRYRSASADRCRAWRATTRGSVELPGTARSCGSTMSKDPAMWT